MAAKKSSVSIESLRETVKNPLQPGEAVFIITVTLYYVGVVVEVTDTDVLLGGASVVCQIRSIGDTFAGREKLEAIEVLPEEGCALIPLSSVVCTHPWRNPLPTAKAK